MDLDRFWELVKAAAVADDVDCRVQAELLTAMLEQLASQEIVSFGREVDPALGDDQLVHRTGATSLPYRVRWGVRRLLSALGRRCCPPHGHGGLGS